MSGYHICNKAIRIVWAFDDNPDRELCMYFPDDETYQAFDKKLRGWAEQIVEEGVDNGKAIAKMEDFIENTGVAIEGFENIPLVSAIELVRHYTDQIKRRIE